MSSKPSVNLGAAARDAGIEALIVPSARHPGYANVAVIRDRLMIGSAIRIHEPSAFPAATETEIHGVLATRTPARNVHRRH
jgi:hypothetical protein